MLNSLLNGSLVHHRKAMQCSFAPTLRLPIRSTEAKEAFECSSSAVSSARPSKNSSGPAATITYRKTLSLRPRLSLRSEQGRHPFWGVRRPSSEIILTSVSIPANSSWGQTLSAETASGKGKNANFS
jgi:hypothetical protein